VAVEEIAFSLLGPLVSTAHYRGCGSCRRELFGFIAHLIYVRFQAIFRDLVKSIFSANESAIRAGLLAGIQTQKMMIGLADAREVKKQKQRKRKEKKGTVQNRGGQPCRVAANGRQQVHRGNRCCSG
jgi:hypothetical protein